MLKNVTWLETSWTVTARFYRRICDSSYTTDCNTRPTSLIRFNLTYLWFMKRTGRQNALHRVGGLSQIGNGAAPFQLRSILLFSIGDNRHIRKTVSIFGHCATKTVRKSSWFRFAGCPGCACERERGGGTNQWQQLAFDWTGNQCGWRGGAEQTPPGRISVHSLCLDDSNWVWNIFLMTNRKQNVSLRQRWVPHPQPSMSNVRGRWNSWCAINSHYWVVWARTHKSGRIR